MAVLYSHKKLPLYLFCLHGIIALVFILVYGFNTDNEGKKFLAETQLLLQGNTDFVWRYQLLNLSYLLYLLPFVALTIHPIIIILVTHTITLYAYYKFYQLLKMCYSQLVAITWLAGMLLCPLFLYWNFSLYSESLFIALTLLFVCSLFQSNKLFTSFILGALLLFCRPAGIFVILLAGLLKLISLKKINLKQSFAILFVSLGAAFFIVFFFVPLHFKGVAIHILNGSIICGLPQHHVNQFPTTNYTLYSAYAFFIEQYGFIDFLLLLFKKAVSFFNISRAHYSTIHNVINLFFSALFIINFVTLYLTIKNVLKSYFHEVLFIQLYIVLNCMLVVVFFNEWTERYTMVVFPFLFLSTAFIFNHYKLSKKSAI